MTIQRVSTFFAFSLCLCFSTFAQEPGEPQMAPPPYIDQPPMPEGRGFIPPRLDLDHLTENVPVGKMTFMAPTAWDWRSEGKVTPIKNQSVCGSCYSFASLANFESKLLIDEEGTFDLSENHAKECNYQQTSCGGGSYEGMANLFSQQGVTLESCDPYVAADVACNSGCTLQKTLLDWRIISGSGVPSTASLQQYIYDNGPVYTSMYTGDNNDVTWQNEYNNYDGSYTMYYTGSHMPNHAVLIVGWDDSDAHAGGTGSWIVKNSWGTGWGGTCGYGAEAGYFKIAYGSGNIGMWSSYVHDYQDYDSDGLLYYYDDAGSTTYWGYNTPIAWSMVKFTPTESGYLSRVEFWTNDVTTDIDIYVYDDYNGSSLSNVLETKLDQSFSEAGYHSVLLDNPPEITSGDPVYVAMRVNNSSYGYPIVADGIGPSETATTYLSSSGSSGSWYDLGVGQSDDIGLRIRTVPTLGLSNDDDPEPVPYSYVLNQNYPNPFNPSTTIRFELKRRSQVKVGVFNLLGQLVATLSDEWLPAGKHDVIWDGASDAGEPVSTGLYFYRIETDEFTQSRKMLLLK